jgi:hypothetical protein
MGKSFNDDVFNNSLNLESINGLNISKEAIEENKESQKPKIDLSNIDLDEKKREIQDKKEKATSDPTNELKRLIQEKDRLSEKVKAYEQQKDDTPSTTYIKKTMIFKKDYLDIIDGLAIINDMQIKDVLNQLLERAINELDEKTREKAIKSSKKVKPVKTEKNIF